jgi:hypothetical protein
LDARSPGPGAFPARGADLAFTIAHPAPVDRLRLRIATLAGGAGSDAVQLARWEVWVAAAAVPEAGPPPVGEGAAAAAVKAAFAAAVRAEFDALVAGGSPPNAAAVAALEAVAKRRAAGS